MVGFSCCVGVGKNLTVVEWFVEGDEYGVGLSIGWRGICGVRLGLRGIRSDGEDCGTRDRPAC